MIRPMVMIDCYVIYSHTQLVSQNLHLHFHFFSYPLQVLHKFIDYYWLKSLSEVPDFLLRGA